MSWLRGISCRGDFCHDLPQLQPIPFSKSFSENEPSHAHRRFCISLGWRLLIECYDVGQYYFIHNTQPPLACIHIHEHGERVFVETITNGQNDFVQSPEKCELSSQPKSPGISVLSSSWRCREFGAHSLFVSNRLIPVSLMALIKCAETYICVCMYYLVQAVYMYVGTHLLVCACVWKPEVDSRCLAQLPPTLVFCITVSL